MKLPKYFTRYMRQFCWRFGPYVMLDFMLKECEAMAEEAAKKGTDCRLAGAGFTCSSNLHMTSRAIKKCILDIHRYRSCPCWVGGKEKWF